MKIWGIIGLVVIGIGGAACTTDDSDGGTGGTAGTGNGGSGATAGTGNGGSGATAGNTTGGTAGNTTGGTAGNTTGGTAGNTTGGTAGNTTGGTAGAGGATSCSTEADFNTCAQCFCAEDQPGCIAFNTAQGENLLCGETCGEGDCATFCADPTKTPAEACLNCADDIAKDSTDANAFIAACQADSDCASFITNLQTCPD